MSGQKFIKNAKKSQFEFLAIWHFLSIFFLIKVTCLVPLFDRKLQVSKNTPKWIILGNFDELLATQNVNLARFARNVEWDFLRDFQTQCLNSSKQALVEMKKTTIKIHHFKHFSDCWNHPRFKIYHPAVRLQLWLQNAELFKCSSVSGSGLVRQVNVDCWEDGAMLEGFLKVFFYDYVCTFIQ